jgi:clan AA aspartic protease (TIGR02281 family)
MGSMKIATLFAVAVWFCAPALAAQAGADTAALRRAYRDGDCFALHDGLRSARGHGGRLDMYRAYDASAFGRWDEAVATAERFIAARPRDRAGRAEAYVIAGTAHAMALRYGQAERAFAAAAALGGGPGFMDNARGGVELWGALRDIPPQTVERSAQGGPVPSRRGQAAHVSVQVEAGGRRATLMLDTGASLSALGDSLARELGVRILDATVLLGTTAAGSTRARLGVLPEVRIGPAVVRNVPVYVLPDAALRMNAAAYQMGGILGLPVIAALGPLTMYADGRVVLEPIGRAPPRAPNVCLWGRTPVVAAIFRGRRLPMELDTGAESTFFYAHFRRAYGATVRKSGRRLVVWGGVAGARKVVTYLIPMLRLDVGGRTVTMYDVKVPHRELFQRPQGLYGLVGQDFFSQVKAMTIDFGTMTLRTR